jgi:hypothetical protein
VERSEESPESTLRYVLQALPRLTLIHRSAWNTKSRKSYAGCCITLPLCGRRNAYSPPE